MENNQIQESVETKKPKKPKTPLNKRKLKFSAYATGFTALFIAAVVVVNVIASYLAENYPLDIDLTADKEFSISEENKNFIRKVDKEVEIIVCATEEVYSGGSYAEFLANYQGIQDSTGGKYFSQSVELLKEYQKLNKKLKLSFVDPQDPSFSSISQKYPEASFAYGDFLITRDVEGKPRYKLLKTQDIYTTQDSSGYGYGPFSITGSNVESAVTSAVYAVSSDKTYKVAVLSGHGESSVSELEALMKEGNYEFTPVASLVTGDIPKDSDIVLIAGPSTDYAGDELVKISNFLADNDESDKGLYYIADASKPKLTNLWEFLAEWGIKLNEGVVYETDTQMHMQGEPTIPVTITAESDYTKALASSNVQYTYVAQNNQAITRGFESKDSRTTTSIVTFAESAVMRPYGSAESWKPADAKTGEVYNLAMISHDLRYDGTDPKNSYVAAFSSIDLVNAQWNQYKGVGNMPMMRTTADKIVRAGNSDISISNKVISQNTFQVTEAQSKTIGIIFTAVLPIGILVLGLVIWYRRKNL